MSQQHTYGRWYLESPYGRTVTIDLAEWPDRMAWVESRAAEVAAEVTMSLTARRGTRETTAQYGRSRPLECDRVTVTASAPALTVHSGQRPALRPYSVPRGWVAPKDLQSRCTAAARLTLSGRQWTAEDIAECASAIMLATLDRQSETVRHGRPTAVLAYVTAVLADSGRAPNIRRMLVGPDAGHVGPDAASMARLTHLAANWRRGEDRQRQRDASDSAKRAKLTGLATVTVDDGRTAGPETAARTAITALQNLGLPPKVARRIWPLAYTCARGEDMDGETLAAELNMSHAAYRQSLSRAKTMIHPERSYSPEGARTVTADAARLLAAVCAECEAIATDPRSVATDASDGPDWPARSAKLYRDAPVTVTRDVSVKRDGRRTYAPADWTAGLAANTVRRLATASAMNRARADGRTAAETETRRLAAGLPATVR